VTGYLDVGEGFMPVDMGLALVQNVQARAIQDIDDLGHGDLLVEDSDFSSLSWSASQ
jgi:hypothetical protein